MDVRIRKIVITIRNIRLLTGVQDESGADMEKIAQALGKDIEFFLKDSISIPEINHFTLNKIAFYAGEPSKKQERIANQLIDKMIGEFMCVFSLS